MLIYPEYHEHDCCFALDAAWSTEQAMQKSPASLVCVCVPGGLKRISDGVPGPVVWTTWETLYRLHDPARFWYPRPQVSLRCAGGGDHNYTGDVIRVETLDGTWMYVVGDVIDAETGIWETHWPD